MRAVLLICCTVVSSATAFAQTTIASQVPRTGPVVVYPPGAQVAQRQQLPIAQGSGLSSGTVPQPTIGATIGSAATQVIELRQGAQTTLAVTTPFSSVSVSDNEVVDALPRSDRVLVLNGKKPGTSDIMIFSDATKVFHATIVVTQPTFGGKVYNHNAKELGKYQAYQCNPVCQRTEDKFEQKDFVVLGGGGASAASGPTIIFAPGAAPR